MLFKHYKDALSVEGKPVVIMKELPKKGLETRKDYKTLTKKLREQTLNTGGKFWKELASTIKDLSITKHKIPHRVTKRCGG